MRLLPLLLLLALTACKTTPDRPEPTDPDEAVTINPDELEPMRRFVLETRRVLAAEFVRIEASQQFFEQQMGFTRVLRYCKRSPVTVLEDGTRVIEIVRLKDGQETNIDPDLLPRVYFGTNTGSIYASTDGGETWDEIARHLPTVLGVEAVDMA